MVNEIKNTILKCLKNEFPDYKRYGEKIKQGFQEPCFFIAVVSSESQQKMVGKRYLRTATFDLHFFPDKEAPNEQMYEMGDFLYVLLEELKVNDLVLYGKNMTYEITNGVLHFFVDYSYWITRVTEPDAYMEKLSIERAELRIENRTRKK